MDVSSSNAPPFIYILLKKKCVLIAVYSVVAYHGKLGCQTGVH